MCIGIMKYWIVFGIFFHRKDVVQILMQDDYLMSRDQLNTLGIDPEGLCLYLIIT